MDDLAPQHGVLLFPEVDIMPEVMDGKLATPYAAITLLNGRFQNPLSDLQNVSKRNTFYSFSQDLGWLRLTNVYAKTETGEIVNTTDPISYSIKIAPGQMMSIPIEILPRKDDTKPLQSLHFFIEFTEIVTREKFTVQSDPHSLKRRVWNDIYKMTFIDYDKSVQFGNVFANNILSLY